MWAPPVHLQTHPSKVLKHHPGYPGAVEAKAAEDASCVPVGEVSGRDAAVDSHRADAGPRPPAIPVRMGTSRRSHPDISAR